MKKHMVKPVEVQVRVEATPPPPKRETLPGVSCPHCQGVEIRVLDTKQLIRSRAHPQFLNVRTRVVRRYFQCTCGKRWPQTSEITERIIPQRD